MRGNCLIGVAGGRLEDPRPTIAPYIHPRFTNARQQGHQLLRGISPPTGSCSNLEGVSRQPWLVLFRISNSIGGVRRGDELLTGLQQLWRPSRLRIRYSNSIGPPYECTSVSTSTLTRRDSKTFDKVLYSIPGVCASAVSCATSDICGLFRSFVTPVAKESSSKFRCAPANAQDVCSSPYPANALAFSIEARSKLCLEANVLVVPLTVRVEVD